MTHFGRFLEGGCASATDVVGFFTSTPACSILIIIKLSINKKCIVLDSSGKVSILDATHREAVRTIAGAHVGIAATEVETARIGAANRT